MVDLPVRREDPDLPAPREGFAGFQMTGKTPATWQELRPQFISSIKLLVEQLIQQDDTSSGNERLRLTHPGAI